MFSTVPDRPYDQVTASKGASHSSLEDGVNAIVRSAVHRGDIEVRGSASTSSQESVRRLYVICQVAASKSLIPNHCKQEVTMTTRAEGMRRITTTNAAIAAVSAVGVVGLSVILAQQTTHHTAAAVPAAVTSTTSTTPAASTSSANSNDDATTTVTTTPQATVAQATSGSVQHAVTSGS